MKAQLSVLNITALSAFGLLNKILPCIKKYHSATLNSESRVIFLAVRRRKFIRVISYLVAVSVFFASAGFFSQRAKAGYEETLGKVRLSNLTSACDYIREASSGLRILAVSSGDSLADSKAFVRARIMAAAGCLNCFEKTKNINKFLNGTYGFAEDFNGTDKERETAINLSLYAQEIYYHLNDVSSAVINGRYALTEYGSIYKNDSKPYFEEYLDFSNGKEKEIFELIAPASADSGGYEILNGSDKISEQAAKETAGRVIGINSALWRSNESAADIEVYALKYGDITVEITKYGGLLYGLINPKPCAKAFYSKEEAADIAMTFLKRRGFGETEQVSAVVGEFTAVFSFAPIVNGVLLVNAPVKTTVCLASGEITHLDASSYIKNYRTDVFAEDSIPDIASLLPQNLELHETRQCYADIGSTGRMCVLAVCGFDGDEVKVYIDSSSMKVVKTEMN